MHTKMSFEPQPHRGVVAVLINIYTAFTLESRGKDGPWGITVAAHKTSYGPSA